MSGTDWAAVGLAAFAVVGAATAALVVAAGVATHRQREAEAAEYDRPRISPLR